MTSKNASMDDLVSTLSSTCNIGQEAQDLAALQAQLVLSLSNQSSNQTRTGRNIPFGQQHVQPCNTPTRTPTNGFDWSLASVSNNTVWREVEELEDERMVEDLLVPSSPTSTPIFPLFSSPSTTTPTSGVLQQHQMNSAANPLKSGPYISGSPTSVFASTDPFYVAQVLAMQQNGHAKGGMNPNSPSLFYQMGNPPSHSPFQNSQPQRQSPSTQTQHVREHYPSINDNCSQFISTLS